MSTLKIENLHVSIEDKEILKGIDLEVSTGEFHALRSEEHTSELQSPY